MRPSFARRHPFLRWYEVLMVRLLIRSPRVRGLLIHSDLVPLAWVVRKTYSTKQPVEMLERAFANSPDTDPAA